MNQNNRLRLLGKTIPAASVPELLEDVERRVENHTPPYTRAVRDHARTYLGFIAGRTANIVSDFQIMRDALPEDEIPQVELGAQLYMSRADMEAAYGSRFFHGATKDPESFDEDARAAADAVWAVQYHMGDSVVEGPLPPAQV